MRAILLWVVLAAGQVLAQPACPATPVWSSCDLVFDLEANESANQAELRAEFKSPRHRTYLMNAFRDGDRKLVIRFSPTESGAWEYRLISNLSRLDDKLGQFTASESDSPGFVRVANVHHFATENNQPHLWMAAPIDHFMTIPRVEFDALAAQRAKEKFTHVRVTLDANADLKEAADRVRAVNAKGLVADLVLSAIPEDWRERERYLGDLVPRFAAFDITWAGFSAFESVPHARSLLKEAGTLLKKFDPYHHLCTSMAAVTSAPLLGDSWMDLTAYGTPDANVGAVEHQLYQAPAINAGVGNERDLWNATMNGQYPAGGSGPYMTAWFEFMSGNRYWDLEPYFGVDGARAIALEGVEYIVYIEKPGPVEVTVERHGYEVAWINPATGERIKGKEYKGEHFASEPPDKSHDWVLHLSREAEKAGMLRSYKFESRPVPVQEVEILSETNSDKFPFVIAEPQVTDVSVSHPPFYALKVRRDTRATRSLLVEWTVEVTIDGEGYRVAGSGKEGTLQIPRSIVSNFPAVLSVRAVVLNANGKAYLVDRVYRLTP